MIPEQTRECRALDHSTNYVRHGNRRSSSFINLSRELICLRENWRPCPGQPLQLLIRVIKGRDRWKLPFEAVKMKKGCSIYLFMTRQVSRARVVAVAQLWKANHRKCVI